jgi:tetratricopeptide (TPR) repeat protein
MLWVSAKTINSDEGDYNLLSQLADSQDLHSIFSASQRAAENHEWQEAVALCLAAESLAPFEFRLPNNRANAHWLANQPDEAWQAYRRSIELEPSDHRPWRGLGNVLRDLNRFEQADRAFQIARQLQPNPETAWNHSQVLIGLERYDEAWLLSEQRLEVCHFEYHRPGPYFQGWDEQSQKPLVIWSEQGFGDTFQFLRWLTRVGPTPLTLEVENPLVPLLREGLSWLPQPPEVVAKDDATTQPTCHGSLMSLPRLLGGGTVTQEAFAGGPYLRIHTAPHPKGHRIGVVWAAGRKLDDPFTAREYHKRSLSHEALEHLLRGLHQLGLGPVNLQVGPDRDELDPALAELFVEALPQKADFLEAGRLIQSLDAVITVDTAMAHQAGAQGVPTWVLLPWSADPRWLRGRSDSPWYPTLRLLRQGKDCQWAPVIKQLLEQLRTIPPTTRA